MIKGSGGVGGLVGKWAGERVGRGDGEQTVGANLCVRP
jgi:hypothetical protein